MKKQIALALTAALLAFPVAPGMVMADTASTEQTATTSGETNVTTAPSEGTPATVQDQNGETVDPGTLPDSPLYWFQTLIEKVQVALTFDPVKKTELIEHQACERLAEAQALIEKGDTEEAEKTLTAYSEKIEQAQTFLDQLKDPNSETAQKVQTSLTQVNTNNMVVLGGLLEKLPPQAAQKLALNIVRSVEKAVAKAERMEGRADSDPTADTIATTSTQTSSVDNTTAMTEAENKAQLKKQAKQALEQFQIELGLKKADPTPNGNAYGYYKDEKDQEDQEDINTQQKQTRQETRPQYQDQQPQKDKINQSAKISAEKDHEDRDNNKKDQKGENERHRD